MDERTAAVAAVAALAEPTRRRLYDHVVGQSRPVTRDQAAAAELVSRGPKADAVTARLNALNAEMERYGAQCVK